MSEKKSLTRREFLKYAGLAGSAAMVSTAAGCVVPTAAPPAAEVAVPPVRR